MITGAALSTTVTVNVHVALFPAASVAVYSTIVVPAEKVLPGECVEVRVPPAQLSGIVGAVQLATAWQDASALTVMFDGQLAIVGGTLSITVTLNEQDALFPDASVAV